MENSSITRLIENAVQNGIASPLKASGLPITNSNCQLPDDMKEFYENYGGLVFYENSPFPIRIMKATEIRQANLEMFKGVSPADISKTLDDPSWSWYFLAECVSDTEEKVVIDLSLPNNGSCYDCYWVTYPGDSELVAHSFTEFISSLINYKGDFIPWK